jgi:nucleoid-associated protein YgaU
MTRIKNPMTGVFNLTVLRTVPAATSSYKLYTWQANDRADLVAAKELGNPTLWWSIFDINPEVINPLNVQPGTVLRLPQSPVVNQGTLMQ